MNTDDFSIEEVKEMMLEIINGKKPSEVYLEMMEEIEPSAWTLAKNNADALGMTIEDYLDRLTYYVIMSVLKREAYKYKDTKEMFDEIMKHNKVED